MLRSITYVGGMDRPHKSFDRRSSASKRQRFPLQHPAARKQMHSQKKMGSGAPWVVGKQKHLGVFVVGGTL